MNGGNYNYNPRRGGGGYATGDQPPHHQHHPQGNPQSGLRRSHLYGGRFNTGGVNVPSFSQSPLAPIQNHSRPEGSKGYGHNQQQQLVPLTNAGDYFGREASSAGPHTHSPTGPLTRFNSRFAHKQINIPSPASPYGLPPTPESDVSLSRNTTPPRHRDHQFTVDMMQRMTQHAKISPLNQFSHLKQGFAEENLVVDDSHVDRLVARAEERSYGTARAIEGVSTDPVANRRVGFRSPEAVEGAREASRRLNGASTLTRPHSMYEVAPKPAEPNPTSNMYAELKRTLSESSSERPKRVPKPAANPRQLPPLSPVQKRHVEVRPRRPLRSESISSTSHTPSPQQNSYYQQESRPKTAPTQEDPITNIDWLAAAQDITEDLSEKQNTRVRPRTASSGTPLAASRNPSHSQKQHDLFGGELRLETTNSRPMSAYIDKPATEKPARLEAHLPQRIPRTGSNSYLQHDLVDFISEDDLTLSILQENRPPAVTSPTRARKESSGSKTPSSATTSKPQEASFLKSDDPDETLDTLRQLSRLLSGNTPAKSVNRSFANLTSSKMESKLQTTTTTTSTDAIIATSQQPSSRQPYKHQERPVNSKPTPRSKPYKTEPAKGSELAGILRNVAQKRAGQASAPATLSTKPKSTSKTATPSPFASQTVASKTIQFEEGYETDDSLDRLLINDTDYASLLSPAAFEDESFLQGTVQVASQLQGGGSNDLEGLALRTKVLNNLQTVQLDIRETRKGLESIERRFGMLEDEGVFKATGEKEASSPLVANPATRQRNYVIMPRRKQKALAKGIFRRPWGFKDFFFAFLLFILALLLVEYKLWSDTIIPQYSKVSSDEWFAKHPVGSYKPGGTFRAMFRVVLWFSNIIWFCLEQVHAVLLWILAGIQWLEVRVMDAISPLPPEFEYVKTGIPEAVPSVTTATATATATVTTLFPELDVETLLPL
ncbi:hypothetical protein ABW19_dt0209382 [Dactylella cylindrospora]|nr:hypothetical protein ABW19_dt0209382 [Dactylella cylindrospora]